MDFVYKKVTINETISNVFMLRIVLEGQYSCKKHTKQMTFALTFSEGALFRRSSNTVETNYH